METNKPFQSEPFDAPGSPQTLSKDDRNWGMLAHLSALSGYVIPFGWFLGPLVVWLVKREEIPFVNDQGREALNFNISMCIYALISAILFLVLVGFVLIVIVMVLHLVFTLIATIKASEGNMYRYPLTIRFVN
ncbi:MAG: DUF4870 domain-containing protein [Bacteroidia bacterium]